MHKSIFWLFLTIFMVGMTYLLADLTELDFKISGVIAGITGVLLFLMFDIRHRNKSTSNVDELRRKHQKEGDPVCPSSKPSNQK